jgi:hypothetical protein
MSISDDQEKVGCSFVLRIDSQPNTNRNTTHTRKEKGHT